jgi:predicted GNAT superfamily acetyltransferase
MIDIAHPRRPDELAVVNEVLQEIWGTDTPIMPLEMLVAIAHSGGYVAIARHDDRPVGASVALLAVHDGRPALHSHITGLLPQARATGLGRMLKLHQRDWARQRGIERIVWTFDPLVRRNAWFNIAILGADVDAYLPSFYGAMTDAINAGDESDRLLMAWDVSRTDPRDPSARRRATWRTRCSCRPRTTSSNCAGRDPAAVAAWRTTTREALTAALDAGRRCSDSRATALRDRIGSMNWTIEHVELRRIAMPLVSPFRTSFGSQTERDILLVRVDLDAGRWRRHGSRAGASAWRCPSRATRPSTSTAPST